MGDRLRILFDSLAKAHCRAWFIVLGGLMLSHVTWGQIYPNKPIRMIVPSQAGGGADIIARALANKMSASLGQLMVIDNRMGIVGADVVAKSLADGYTLLFTTSALAVREAVYQNLPFNSLHDFQPISQAITQSNVLVVHPGVPAKTVRELIAVAKKNPGLLNYGSGGNATSAHLAGELFRLLAGIQVVHVPYRGVPAALADTIAARVQFTFASPVSALPQVREGRLRLLAFTTAKRTQAFPDVPTVGESGLSGYEFMGWMGLLCPIATQSTVVQKLYEEVKKVVFQPEVRQHFVIEAAEPVGSRPEEFRSHLEAEIKRWALVVKQAGIKAD